MRPSSLLLPLLCLLFLRDQVAAGAPVHDVVRVAVRETWDDEDSGIDVRPFIQLVNDHTLTGHYVKVCNPLPWVSFVPPLDASCAAAESRPRVAAAGESGGDAAGAGGAADAAAAVPGRVAFATVRDTALEARCTVAFNAGESDSERGRCVGYLKHKGQLLNEPDEDAAPRVAFGLDRDRAEWIIGYLSPLDVRGNVTELVSGHLWLVRQGESHLEASAVTEKVTDIHELDTVSARVSVGHDTQGCMLAVQVDGEESLGLGATMEDMVQLMLRFQAVNAIALSSGAAASTVVNDTLVSMPMSKCGDEGMFRCEEPVTSVLCVREATLKSRRPDDIVSHTTSLIFGLVFGALGIIAAIAASISYKHCKETGDYRGPNDELRIVHDGL